MRVGRRRGCAGGPKVSDVDGLHFRPWRGESDLPEMARVANAAREADGDEDVATVEGMRVEYANLTNSDPYRDAILAEVDGRLVAYSRVEWEDQTTGGRSYVCFGFVDPAWRRRGIGRALLHANEARLREMAAAHAHDRPRWFGSWGSDRNAGNTALLVDEGYVAVRHFYEMLRPDLDGVEELPLPSGMEIRPVRPEDHRRLFDADAEAFLDHWGGIDSSDAAFRRWTRDPNFDPSLFVVAWDGDEIAAAVLNLIDPEVNARYGVRRGVLDAVFTRRPWRRRGLARALIARSFVLLRERGMTSAWLGVDAENPHEALGLYKDAGFAIHRSSSAYRKPFDPVVGPEWG